MTGPALCAAWKLVPEGKAQAPTAAGMPGAGVAGAKDLDIEWSSCSAPSGSLCSHPVPHQGDGHNCTSVFTSLILSILSKTERAAPKTGIALLPISPHLTTVSLHVKFIYMECKGGGLASSWVGTFPRKVSLNLKWRF